MPNEPRVPSLRHLDGSCPIPGGIYDLASVGYREQEFTVEGEAQSYELVGDRTEDGRWTAKPAADAEYVSRVVARTPIDPARFSGTVVVEWNNVSGGIDAGPEWMFFHRYLIDAGHAHVGVTAQKAGIDGGGLVEGFHLRVVDPERYEILRHPGDAWSFDIFTQVGALVRSQGNELLNGLNPTRYIAMGESQSASFLVTYVNAIDPNVELFDGFFIHGRPGTAASLDGVFVSRRGASVEEVARSFMQGGEQIRADVRVPVLVLQSETDVILLGGGTAGQPDGANLRLWEVAGAAHADTYLLVVSLEDDGQLTTERRAEMMRPTTKVLAGETDRPINSGPQQHYVGQAALDHLIRWADGGPPPPEAARLVVDDGGLAFVVDQHGNAIAGVRTPWVDVPTSRLSGLGQTGEGFAALFGTTELFDDETLAGLYTGGRSEYLQRFTESLDSTIEGGFIRGADRAEILAVAGASYPLD